MSLEILLFPKDWSYTARNGKLSFAAQRCKASSSCPNFADGYGVVMCSCHQYCQLHCEKALDDESAYMAFTTWRQLLRPYVSIVPSTAWNAHVLKDLVHKLNAIDECNLSCLLGLLVNGSDDDDVLCRLFLELGVDAEVRYMQGPGPVQNTFVKEAINVNAIGGTAVHFATLFGRPKCLKALLDAGCDVNAANAVGKTALELAQDQNVKDLLTEATTNGQKSLGQLAKEGLFFAIRNRMRTGKVDRKELVADFFEGKSVINWLNAIVSGKHVIPNNLDASMVAGQILAEMQYRYDFRNLPRAELLSQAIVAAGSDAEFGAYEEDPSKILYLMLEGITNLLGKGKEKESDSSRKDVDATGDEK